MEAGMGLFKFFENKGPKDASRGYQLWVSGTIKRQKGHFVHKESTMNFIVREYQKHMILRLPLFFLITAIGIYQLRQLVYHSLTKNGTGYANTLPIKNSSCPPIHVPLKNSTRI
jgi:hypothetical protein